MALDRVSATASDQVSVMALELELGMHMNSDIWRSRCIQRFP
jgi:hypothetical protein